MSEHEASAPERAHSRFGGSKASIWLNCAGSVALAATVPTPATSKYAAEGTAAHALAEHCLVNGEREACLHVGEWFPLILGDPSVQRFECTDAMAAAVQVYLDAVYEELDVAPDAELYVEQKFVFDLASAPGEVFGSNDATVYTPSRKRMVVFDYKHGQGVSVSVEDNAQLKFYGAGAALGRPWLITDVELVIVQPRARDAETEEHGGVKRWAMDPLEILEFAAEIEAGVAAAKMVMRSEPFAVNGIPDIQMLNAGSWCRWCPAAGICPARQQQALQGATLDFADIADLSPKNLPVPKDIDTGRIAAILRGADVLEEWIGQLREYAFSRMVEGVVIPGYKLVDKVGRRNWTDNPEEIAAYLELMYGLDPANTMPPSLETITEVERLLKAALPDKADRRAALDDLSLRFTIKHSTGLTMVADSDRRDAVDAVSRDFADVADIGRAANT